MLSVRCTSPSRFALPPMLLGGTELALRTCWAAVAEAAARPRRGPDPGRRGLARRSTRSVQGAWSRPRPASWAACTRCARCRSWSWRPALTFVLGHGGVRRRAGRSARCCRGTALVAALRDQRTSVRPRARRCATQAPPDEGAPREPGEATISAHTSVKPLARDQGGTAIPEHWCGPRAAPAMRDFAWSIVAAVRWRRSMPGEDDGTTTPIDGGRRRTKLACRPPPTDDVEVELRGAAGGQPGSMSGGVFMPLPTWRSLPCRSRRAAMATAAPPRRHGASILPLQAAVRR